jgi:DNA polymerase-3 subunit alpha
MDSKELLWHWCREGWRFRKIAQRPKQQQDWYAERVKYEMNLILEKGFADYFLMVSDAIRWGKDNGVAFGPGRGSVAASNVAWLIRITEIDPERHRDMIFERFIDVSRADPPDIDIDCSDEDRWKIKEYLSDKYGAACVGQIANYVRYRGKNSLGDVARVYGIPISAKEVVSNLVIERSGGDSRFDATLEDTFEFFPAAADMLKAYPKFAQAPRLEGDIRGMSVHAAGLVISSTPLTDICAVYERDGVRCVSFDKYDAEYLNVLKLDFLGLTTMGMIARCLELAGLTLEDLYAIPDTDQETIDLFRRGDVTGVFQFEGRATRIVNRDVCPDNFAHIADINALSRPGPLFSGQTAEYVSVRHGRGRPTRMHPLVDEITNRTYGQIIYQEQILRILREMGGFDWFSVGEIRRIISKKLGEAAFQMSSEKFAEGAERLHGINREMSDKIWKRLVTSGTYSFNIAHAISYSTLAFWTAWLKTHHQTEFYAASLAKASGDQEAQFRLMKDALGHGHSVVPPILNASHSTWHSVPHLGIVAGWQQVPGIGAKTADRIDELRWGPDGKKFNSWDDLQKVPGIGPKTVESMEMFATAHDPFGLLKTGQKMTKVKKWIRSRDNITHCPFPTHDGAGLSVIQMPEIDRTKKFQKGPRVIYCGIVKAREYKDIVEDTRSRTGQEVEEILANLKRSDLIKTCSIRCFDTTEEEVYVRVNRWVFPRLKSKIDSIAVGHDVIVVEGNRISGFGTPVMAEKIWVINPDD